MFKIIVDEILFYPLYVLAEKLLLASRRRASIEFGDGRSYGVNFRRFIAFYFVVP